MNAPITNDNSNKYKCSIYIKALSAIAIDQVNTLNATTIVMKTIETQLVFYKLPWILQILICQSLWKYDTNSSHEW